MKQPPTFVLRAVLGSASLVTTPAANGAWPCYVSAMPDETSLPDDAVAVYDTPGTKEGRIMVSGEVIESFGVQIKVRARSYMTGFEKMGAIQAHIDQVVRLGIDAGFYLYFIPAIMRGPVLSLGMEPGTKRRYLFTLNVEFKLQESGPYDPLENGEDMEAFYNAAYHFNQFVQVDADDFFV